MVQAEHFLSVQNQLGEGPLWHPEDRDELDEAKPVDEAFSPSKPR